MGEIRIIAGRYRGRKIHFPDTQSLRPSPDRVRVTLFNWLMPYIQNAICLDAFAGSGALGFEACSRGAKHVDFVEQHSALTQSLQQHAQRFGAEQQLAIYKTDTLAFLGQAQAERYDIIFLDPPFHASLYESVIAIIEARKLLKTGGHLYIESAQHQILDPQKWSCLREKKAGQVHYYLFEKKS